MFVKKFDNFRFYVRPLCELQLFAALDAYDIRHHTRTWNSAQRWHITKTLHMPRLIVVFTSFYAFILALKKSGEVEQSDRHLCAEFQVRVW